MVYSAECEQKVMIQSIPDLLEYLELDPSNAPYTLLKTSNFPFLVSREYAERMSKKNWFDPLLLQVLPRSEEEQEKPGFSSDPVADQSAVTVPGVLHKYCARVLLIASSACPVHCRFCFRRCFSYTPVSTAASEWERAWQYIQKDQTISEVIISGGEPLLLTNEQLESMITALGAIDHITAIRIHTRIPITLPSRIDRGLCALLSKLCKTHSCVFVIHCNHPQELSVNVREGLSELRRCGVLLFNQSVLLKGINDSVATLKDLCLQCIASGVVPYYLHQLDQVQGAWHFEVEESEGKELITALRKQLPGYAMYRYVKEIPSMPSKMPL